MKMRIMLLAILFTAASLRPSHAQVTLQDSIALVALYNATNGVNWTNNTNWLNGPVGGWYGVSIFNQRVTQLEMDDNGLSGFIPDAIGALTGLVELSIGNSVFQGAIPESIGQLSSLYSLNIRQSGLTGQIPQSLGNCNQLANINLSRNMLEGEIPVTLDQCTLLYSIQLQENVLSGGFPMLFLSLPKLRTFNISKNQFTGTIPPELNEITTLTGLFLSENQFEGSFPSVANLSLLEGIDISVNAFTGDLDTILGYYPEMRNLYIHDNQLSGTLSTAHFVPEKMIRIWAFNNHLSSLGVFTDWVNYPGFVNVYVTNNDLDFDDLLPNSSMPANKFLCQTQNPIGIDTVVSLVSGDSYSITSPMQDQGIQYQWFFNHQLISGASGPEFTIEPFSPEKAGTYFFTATHPAFPTMTLLSATITLEEETTSTTVTEMSYLRMYPNPTSDEIILVSDPDVAAYEVRLYTPDGYLLITKKLYDEKTILSLKDLPAGMYVLKTISPSGHSLKRVIKL
jgi:hypothetical protein